MPSKAARPTSPYQTDASNCATSSPLWSLRFLALLGPIVLLTACSGRGSKGTGDEADISDSQSAEAGSTVSGIEADWSFSATDASSSSDSPASNTPDPPSASIRLVDVHAQAGITHTYQNGANGAALISETIGAGCGWIDFDLDGRIDLFLNQAGTIPLQNGNAQPLDSLFRNLGSTGKQAAFVDNTSGSRIIEPGYSQGVAIADFDNDGFDDIYVTNLGENRLWRNLGDGTFANVSAPSGTNDKAWGTSAAWADLDRDGDLDLYVCNYCDFDPADPISCLDREGRPTVCNPAELAPQPDAVFLNLGDGTFSAAAEQLGLQGEGNRALGVAIADFTNDGLADIYVANDTTENFLFVNDGNGAFLDEATLRGCAVDRAGGPQG
ncbi:MAG: VCBS repeat-containing protein, partial [Planctomycetota bacterium]